MALFKNNLTLKQFNNVKGSTPLQTTGQSKKRMRFLTGFTLIELIVVVAIIAVVSAVSVASFSTLTGDRLEADARKIINDLCWARQLAVARHDNYIADFELANERYVIYRTSVLLANQIKTQNLSPGVNLAAIVPAPPSSRLTFRFPDGTIQEAGTFWTITLNYQGKTRLVRVFRNTGYVRIE